MSPPSAGSSVSMRKDRLAEAGKSDDRWAGRTTFPEGPARARACGPRRGGRGCASGPLWLTPVRLLALKWSSRRLRGSGAPTRGGLREDGWSWTRTWTTFASRCSGVSGSRSGTAMIAEAIGRRGGRGELVALLALADGRRLVRDQVIERLWPHLGAEAGAANLRKAAHHARRALGDPDAIVLRSGRVELFPARAVTTDVEALPARCRAALRDADADAVRAGRSRAARGSCCPTRRTRHGPRTPRRLVQARLAELLRRSGDWERLMEVEPTDEAACRELMRAAIDAGRRHVAIRWFERLRIALVRELGAQPDAETRALYDRCTAGVRLGERVFVGREVELADAAGQLRSVSRGGGTAALLVRGPTGIGKSAFCREVVHGAHEGGWRIITVAATASGHALRALIGAAIEQLLVGGRASLDALPERTRSILAELSPLAVPAPPLQGSLTRHQVVAALRRALALPGSSSPTVLCVEDAHLLDEATADVLHQLVAGGGGDPLLVMLAYRAEWMRTSLPRGITELARSDRTLSLQLGPLDDGAIAELVALAAPVRPAAESVARIVGAAHGSPFFALELTRAPMSAVADPLPQTVRQAIIERLVGLDATTMDALTALAVAEEELDLASVLALTGLGERDAFALLDAALDAGVLVVAGDALPVPPRARAPSADRRAAIASPSAAAPRRRPAAGDRRRRSRADRRSLAEGRTARRGGRLAAGRHAPRGRRRRLRRRAGADRAPADRGAGASRWAVPARRDPRRAGRRPGARGLRNCGDRARRSRGPGAAGAPGARAAEGERPRRRVAHAAGHHPEDDGGPAGRGADAQRRRGDRPLRRRRHRRGEGAGGAEACGGARRPRGDPRCDVGPRARGARQGRAARPAAGVPARHPRPARARHARLRRAAVRHRADALRRASQRRDHRVRRRPRRRGASASAPPAAMRSR